MSGGKDNPVLTGNRFSFWMPRQPDDSSCGPTCLHAVYQFYRDKVPVEQIMAEVQSLEGGGTLAVALARHALSRGYRAIIYTYNLQLFDPTWFAKGSANITDKLVQQAEEKGDPKLQVATGMYLDFLEAGGILRFEELGPGLIRKHLKRNQPILTGLSATYLYEAIRETEGPQPVDDDVRGHPVGHFVVLCGYDRAKREVVVADPLHDNPRFGTHSYSVSIERVLGAILLGVLTYDANLLVLERPRPT